MSHVVVEDGHGFECNGTGPFACKRCRGITQCAFKHDIPWSGERVRERLLYVFIGAVMSAGPWITLGAHYAEKILKP